MIILLTGIQLLPDMLYVLLELLDASFDMDRVSVFPLELGLEEVHMWHDVMKKFHRELKITIFQQHGQSSLFSYGTGVKITRVSTEILSVLKHSIDGTDVKGPSDVAGCWHLMGHHFIKHACPLG